MYREQRVAVVIPAYNEARLLPQTLRGLPPFVDRIIVVDDASEDETHAVALGARRAGLEVLRHARNGGVGQAILTGYAHALGLGVDIIVVVGADAQMDPQEMPRLLDPLVEDEADYAKGDRLGHPELLRRMPWVRVIGNFALTYLTRLSTGYLHLRDSQCGYTALKARALAALPLAEIYPRYGFPNDLLAKLAEIDACVVDRPVTPIYGDERSGIRVLRVLLPISWLLLRSGVRRAWRRWRAKGAKARRCVAADS